MAEPGRLALRILPGRDLGALDRLVQGNCSPQSRPAIRARRSPSSPAERGRGRARPAPPPPRGATVVDHAVETRVDPGDKCCAVGLDDKALRRHGRSAAAPARLPVDVSSGRTPEAPPAPARSAGRRPGEAHRCRRGSSRIRTAMQLARALPPQVVAPPLTDGWRNLRHFGKPLRQARGNRARYRRRTSGSAGKRSLSRQPPDVAQPCPVE